MLKHFKLDHFLMDCITASIKEQQEELNTLQQYVKVIAEKVVGLDHITEQVDNIAECTYLPVDYRNGKSIYRLKLWFSYHCILF